MAAPLLAELLGGTPFLGFISAVAFATILAVVAGLTLSGAAALSHDLWVNVVRGGQRRVGRAAARRAHRDRRARRRSRSRSASRFKGQNVAFMVSLAFAIAASANFPALVLSIFWRAAHHARRGREHGHGHARDAAPDLALADHPGGRARARLGVVPAQEPGARHDPALVRGRDPGLAAPARARGRGAPPRARAADAPRARRGVGSDIPDERLRPRREAASRARARRPPRRSAHGPRRARASPRRPGSARRTCAPKCR